MSNLSGDEADVRSLFGGPADSDESVREQYGENGDARPQTSPRLARGIRWSDLVAEMRHEQAIRDHERAA